jgi:hypothetical protein
LSDPNHFLRITIRCLEEDLGLSPAPVSEPVESLIKNQVVRAFVEKRSQKPEGLEKVEPLTSNIVAYSLHAGELRGVTWHDRDLDVVWLCACRLHRSGKSDDLYPYAKGLDQNGRLLPTEEDLDALIEVQQRQALEALLQEAADRLEEATANPGNIIEFRLGGSIPLRLFVEREEGIEAHWLIVPTRPPEHAWRVAQDWMSFLMGAFFPHASSWEDLSAPGVAPGGFDLEPGETAFCWIPP